MAFEDIGYLLFAQFLGMTEYPGDPFTGNIARDLILFLIVPTIFIIFVVYILLGRLAVQQKQIRLLLGIGVYLFILAGGYYRTFALLAGPYFIFLIFILGLIYFIPSHFRVRSRAMPGGSVGEGAGVLEKLNPGYQHDIDKRIKRLVDELGVAEGQLAKAERGGHDRSIQNANEDIRRIRKAIDDLRDAKRLMG